MIELRGKLREDIQNGNAVLFLGAGAGVQAGLKNSRELAEFLFTKSGRIEVFEKNKFDLARLVAQLDSDVQFTRQWVNRELTDYFLDQNNYSNLEGHIQLLKQKWRAIFTTNYDISLEIAANSKDLAGIRILPISDPDNLSLINSAEPNKIKYFKIHGCANDIDKNPLRAKNFVLTQREFIEVAKGNKNFWDALEKYAWTSSIIFIGFNASNQENNIITSNVINLYEAICNRIKETFSPFVVLPNLSDNQKEDYKNIGLNLLEGTLNDFLFAVNDIKNANEQISQENSKELEFTTVNFNNNKIQISQTEFDDYKKYFDFYYEGFFINQLTEFNKLIQEKKIDLWKSQPQSIFIYSGRCIQRAQFTQALTSVNELLVEVYNSKASRIQIIGGKRASGKTIFTHQLCYEIYKTSKNPIIFLNPEANYGESFKKEGSEINVSGWNAKIIDKFISQFHNNGNSFSSVPIIVADHIFYRQTSIDSLLKHLSNHGKHCLLLLTLNEEDVYYEYSGISNIKYTSRLSQLYQTKLFEINAELLDSEIENLFTNISNDYDKIRYQKERLIEYAKDPQQSNRDILLVLYQWFDKNFRKIEEIIQEESAKLNSNQKLKDLFCSIATFHQYNLKPRIDLCAKACGISLLEFAKLREDSLFKTFIKLLIDSIGDNSELAFTRHPEYSRKILEQLAPNKEDQNNYFIQVLKSCNSQDIQFVRSFF